MGGFLPEATDSVTHPWVCGNPYIEISVLPVFEPRGYTPVRKVVDRQCPVNARLSAQHRESLRENSAGQELSAGLASTDVSQLDPANALTTTVLGMPSHVSEETRLSCVILGQSDKKSPNIKTNAADDIQATPSFRKSIPSYYEDDLMPEGQGKENMHQLENRHIRQSMGSN
jgi:hypothetical protein